MENEIRYSHSWLCDRCLIRWCLRLLYQPSSGSTSTDLLVFCLERLQRKLGTRTCSFIKFSLLFNDPIQLCGWFLAKFSRLILHSSYFSIFHSAAGKRDAISCQKASFMHRFAVHNQKTRQRQPKTQDSAITNDSTFECGMAGIINPPNGEPKRSRELNMVLIRNFSYVHRRCHMDKNNLLSPNPPKTFLA